MYTNEYNEQDDQKVGCSHQEPCKTKYKVPFYALKVTNYAPIFFETIQKLIFP